jgi:hypothetical protein
MFPALSIRHPDVGFTRGACMQKMYAARKSRSFATFMAIIRQLAFLPDQHDHYSL